MRAVVLLALALAIAGHAGVARAQGPHQLTDADLRAYLARPYDKGALMNARVPLGSYRGAQLVADFPCADVCPSHTVRIVHFVLPPATGCDEVDGVMREVLVPVAISMRSQFFCLPPMVVDALAPES